jgi:hypothetical protein
MAFIGLEELLRFLDNRDLFLIGQQTFYFIYPIKALTAGLAIWFFWARYTEVKLKDLKSTSHTGLSIIVGLMVTILWINLDQSFATPESFDDFFPDGWRCHCCARNGRDILAVVSSAVYHQE